jgi:Xaa-Pro aminopeptidase
MDAAGSTRCSIGPGADLRYLTGYHALPLERLTLLVARRDGHHTLITPTLERARAEDAGLPDEVAVVDFGETDDPFAVGGRRARRGAAAGARWAGATGCGRRSCSASRTALPRRAGPRLDGDPRAAHAQVARGDRRAAPGRRRPSTASTAGAGAAAPRPHGGGGGRDIAELILAEGHEEVNFVIVASGPTGPARTTRPASASSPRATPSSSTSAGPSTATARTAPATTSSGTRPEGYAEAHAALEAAQRAACDAVRPGVTAASIDAPPRGARRRGLRRGVRPPHRPRHRPRGARGALHRRRQRPPLSRA